LTGAGAPWQTDLMRAVEEATSLPDLLPGFARHPRESLSPPRLERRLIDNCAAAFARLVSTPTRGGVIAVTSPNRGEGRSTIAAALAIGIARDFDNDTLLLDLDFERPRLADLFRVAANPGLADFVDGNAKLRLIAGSTGRRLWLAPAGRSNSEPPRLCHDLIETGLMAGLRDRFGWIVLDLPPLPEPAAQVSAGMADFYLFLGRHRSTTHSAIKRMLSLAGGDRPAGFLLTGDQSQIPSWIKRLL
jgi:Mrp family chromosome partitioning ATPase